jgi:hypothetical protein
MGKYAKYALVFLYVAQLAIAFREQLVHLYKYAAGTAHREAAPQEGARQPKVVSLRSAMSSKLDPIHVLFAAPHIAVVTAAAAFEEPAHDPGDEHKDRAKRQNKLRRVEFLLANLYRRIRKRPVAPSASEERVVMVERADLFPEAMYAA